MSLPDAAVTEDTQLTKPDQEFKGHKFLVRGIIYLPGGQRIMTCSRDSSLRLWNLQTGQQSASMHDTGRCDIRSIALSADGKRVVSGGSDCVLRLWSVETKKVIAKWTGHTKFVWSVCWDRDGERVLSGSNDGTVRVWHVKTGKTILEINTGLAFVRSAIFSPDSNIIATSGGCHDNQKDVFIKIWDANTGQLISILKGHTGNVNSLAWIAVPDRKILISGSADHSIRTWSTTTWKQLSVLSGHEGSVTGVAVSPNGWVLASASLDRTARLWNLENGQPICPPLQHGNWVECVTFSANGTLLATGCDDKNAYTWNIPAIIKKAGLSDPDIEKSLHANATRARPAQQRENARTLPTGFFGESPHVAITPPELISSERTRPHFFKRFQSDRPGRPNFLQRARLPFFKQPRKRDDEASKLKGRRPPVVDVPFAPGRPRNFSAAEIRAKREKEEAKARQAKIANRLKNAKNAGSSSQQPPQSNVTLVSSGLSQATTPSGPQAAGLTSASAPTVAIPPAAATPETTLPGPVTLQGGCLSRFLLCVGCVSRYPDSRH